MFLSFFRTNQPKRLTLGYSKFHFFTSVWVTLCYPNLKHVHSFVEHHHLEGKKKDQQGLKMDISSSTPATICSKCELRPVVPKRNNQGMGKWCQECRDRRKPTPYETDLEKRMDKQVKAYFADIKTQMDAHFEAVHTRVDSLVRIYSMAADSQIESKVRASNATMEERLKAVEARLAVRVRVVGANPSS